MQSITKKVPGVIALMASIVAAYASAGGQPAGAADPSASHVAIAPVRYESFLPVMPVAPIGRSPADNWKEANRTVASLDSMALTMPMQTPASAGTSPQSPGAPATDVAPPVNPHAGHSMPAVPAPDPHAGHSMPAVPSPDAHAGHKMPARTLEKAAPAREAAKTSDPHAGHKMPAKKTANPHAGHSMVPANPPDPHAEHIVPAAAPDPHSGHVGKEKK